MRQFYLYKRKKVWYIQLINPETGNKFLTKSSGTEDREKAKFIAQKWIYEGLPGDEPQSLNELRIIDTIFYQLSQVQSITQEDVKRFLGFFKSRGFNTSGNLQTSNDKVFIDFLSNFWDYDNSPYVREKLSHGHSITKNYCQGMHRHVVRRWKPYFEEKLLSEITRMDLKIFSQHLAEVNTIAQNGELTARKLTAKSINRVLTVGTIALKWAYENELIKSNPGVNLPKFSGKSKRRGILTDEEVQALFSQTWTGDPAHRLGNLLACQTGLRLGEVVGLRVEDIQNGYIHVRHSWSTVDGLKAPKNGEERIVPVLPELEKALLQHAKLNPRGCGPTSWVFWIDERYEGPYRGEHISRAFNDNLKKIGIKKDERLSRGLTFHCWRHYYAKKMTDALDMRAAKLTGHKTPAMLEHYAAHVEAEDLKKATEATSEIFGNILDFKEAR